MLQNAVPPAKIFEILLYYTWNTVAFKASSFNSSLFLLSWKIEVAAPNQTEYGKAPNDKESVFNLLDNFSSKSSLDVVTVSI